MTVGSIIIPAQIRAGRALLDWSQEDLARAASVAVTSIRDLENQKRATDTGIAAATRRALEDAGIEFLGGSDEAGPGVRLKANQPNLIRRPTSMLKWGLMPFSVEWQGRELTVIVNQEAMEDLGGLSGTQDDAAYLKVFEKHKSAILDGVKAACQEPKNFDRKGRLRLEGDHLVGAGK